MTVLNILLALLGLTGTLSAFGGETWRKGDEPLLTRITRRGYLSLSCLLLAFILGVTKEITIKREKDLASSEQKLTAAENRRLHASIKGLRDSLVTSTGVITKSTNTIVLKVDSLESGNCNGIEQAFKMAVNIPREYDDYVVHIYGQERLVVPGRITQPMEIYWGDTFEYTFFPNDYKGNPGDLESIKLEVAGTIYRLHMSSSSVFEHGSVRIYGSSPKPMKAYILNPKNISGVGIKIFVSSTDATRGQEEFRRKVLTGNCSEYAKKVYKVINKNTVRLLSQADPKSSIRSTLTKGSFVRVLTIVGEWTEVLTPENRQGWILTEKLSTIQG